MKASAKTPGEIDLALGERLREIRLAGGWSQQRLGAALGVTFQQVQKYERGSNRISVSRLIGISSALGVRVERFVRGIG